MKKTPKAVTIHGTIAAQTLPVQPSSANTMKSGTTPSWVGTAIVTTTKTSRGDVAAEPELGERIAGERREEDHRGGRDGGDHQAVAQRLPERDRVEDSLGVAQEVPPGSSGGTSRVITSLVCDPIRNDQ